MDDHRHYILVVDDDNDVRAMLALVLETKGYRVDTAASGPAALAKLRHDRLDLILLDMLMPGMNGFPFLHELRADPLSPALPVILCSASDVTEDEALRGGAIGLIRKPVDQRRLFDLIENVLESWPRRLSEGE